MFSVVLMTALTAGNATPDHFMRGGCRGGTGCYGSNSSCYGSAYGCGGGCYSGGCYGSGCYGSGCYGSGCYGSGCSGGGCYGSGCYGSGCTGSGCYGCHGSTYGCHGSTQVGVGGGCHGCYGGHSAYGSTGGVNVVVPHHGTNPLPTNTKPESKDEDDEVQAVQAKVNIDLPEGAKLYIDGQLMKAGAGSRFFQTPALSPGQTYFYDVRVEIVRNGKTIADTQRIVLRAGQTVAASFANLGRQANDTATVQAGQP